MPLDLRTRAEAHDRLLVARLDALVPALMDRAGLDAWVVAGREHAEDPVLRTMLPATWLGAARRRTILLFLRNGGAVHRMAIARYAVGDAFPAAWDPDVQPAQWQRVAELLVEADPARIGIDTSATFALADGLAASERDALLVALPAALRARVVGAEVAALGWLETRLPEERSSLAEACRISHGHLRRALSGEVIEPGRTTTADVEWWLRNAVDADAHGSWFQPICSVQRPGGAVRDSFAAAPGAAVIGPGDLVHVDFGIVMDGWCTDQQQHAYVLRPAERRAPAGILRAMEVANRLQDLLLVALTAGGTGNDVLRRTREAAAAEGIDGLVYTHPIGLHGHGAGATIGLWDQQDGVPGEGDYPVRQSTAWSIELQARVAAPEWDGQVVQIMLEEDAWLDEAGASFLDGRQEEPWLI
jgi:Xaa-Pro aminopeptidase